jgi:PHD/YefM family antitoxin component YafN of YafNO toxin-antitoxin module
MRTDIMEIIEFNSREFRQNLKKCLDEADNGKKVLIKRNKKSYILVPLSEVQLTIQTQNK